MEHLSFNTLPLWLSIILCLLFVQGAVDAKPEPIWKQLWSSKSADFLKEEAYASKFVSGVVNGTLDPDYWAKYNVQDAYWVLNVGYIWGYAAQVANSSTLKEFATKTNQSWVEYGLDMFHNLTVKPHGVVPDDAASDYLTFIKESVFHYGPQYLLIATYACEKLWPYLEQRCQDDLVKMKLKNNAYSKWCVPEEQPSEQQLLIQDYYEKKLLRLDVAKNMFTKAMKHEISFFNNA